MIVVNQTPVAASQIPHHKNTMAGFKRAQYKNTMGPSTEITVCSW